MILVLEIYKAPSSKDSLIEKLNLIVDDTENDLVPSKYFEPSEISSLLKK